NFDSVTLEQLRQIRYVEELISTLYDKQAGELWSRDEIRGLKKEIEDGGMELSGIESVNIHDAIKTGSSDRDMYIENYIKTLENLGEEGINLVCYNFMPVFDWTRSELAKPRPDGSTVLAYDQSEIDKIDPEKIFESMDKNSNGFILPGWEPERMAKIKDLFEAYADVDDEKLFNNLVYFLKAIMPVCEKYGIKMAIHPDDPSWSVFGLSRIINSKEGLLRMLDAVPSVYNGVTLCTGSLGSNPNNDIIDIIHALKGRIHFAHIRNIKYTAPGKFEEAAHLSADGDLDLMQIVKALYDSEFDGVIRPDHGRMLWGEKAMPGYGLYDRALGAAYICGLWEMLEKTSDR
ncbi:MAG: mannonate dehydratase, partial [Clostridia bacterium]